MMTRKWKLGIVFLLLLFLVGCKGENSYMKEVLSKYIGTEVSIYPPGRLATVTDVGDDHVTFIVRGTSLVVQLQYIVAVGSDGEYTSVYCNVLDL